MNSTLINDENIMVFQPKLAQLLGINETIRLNQIHYWLEKSKNIIDGRPWVYNTYESWQSQICFLSISTIRKAIKKLEDNGIVISNNFNRSKIDKTKWYTIDYEILQNLYEELEDTQLEENTDTADKTYGASDVSTKSISIDTQKTAINEQSIHLKEQSIHPKESEEDINYNKPIPDNTTDTTSKVILKDNKNNEQKENPSSDNFKKVVDFYVDNMRLPGSYELEKIKYLCDEFMQSELIILAIKQAVEVNARNLRYVEKVLYTWRDKGIKNSEEAQKSIEDYKKYKGDMTNGKFTGNHGEDRCYNSKTPPKNSSKWSGYKPPTPKETTDTDDGDLI